MPPLSVAMTCDEFLYRAETVYPDQIAVIDEPTAPDALPTTTYAQLAVRVRAWQAGFDALGVAPGERVAVVSHNSARLLELLYAVPASGRICVPINFRLKADEVDYIVRNCDARVLLVDAELDAALAAVRAPHRFVLGPETDEALMRHDREPRAWVARDENATATINYTSGTTARPKGVRLTHRNLWVNALTFGMHLRAWDRDVCLHTVPTFHCNGWGLPFIAAGVGAPQVVLRKVDGAEILRRVDRHGVTLMGGAPAVFNAVLDAAAEWPGEIPGGDRVRVVCAGAPPPSRTLERIGQELGWEALQIWGLTETSPLLTFNRTRPGDLSLSSEHQARKLARAGAPALGTRLTITGEGEVLARSHTVMAGYWNNAEATAEAFDGGWFHTGDGGTLDDEGHLTISDRKKDVIVSGAENVSSIEVEDTIFGHPGVAEVAVIGVPDDKWGETVKALIVPTPGVAVTEADIIAYCKARLAGYKAPTSVDFRDTIPRTTTGKMQKFKLREPYWRGRTRQVS